MKKFSDAMQQVIAKGANINNLRIDANVKLTINYIDCLIYGKEAEPPAQYRYDEYYNAIAVRIFNLCANMSYDKLYNVFHKLENVDQPLGGRINIDAIFLRICHTKILLNIDDLPSEDLIIETGTYSYFIMDLWQVRDYLSPKQFDCRKFIAGIFQNCRDLDNNEYLDYAAFQNIKYNVKLGDEEQKNKLLETFRAGLEYFSNPYYRDLITNALAELEELQVCNIQAYEEEGYTIISDKSAKPEESSSFLSRLGSLVELGIERAIGPYGCSRTANFPAGAAASDATYQRQPSYFEEGKKTPRTIETLTPLPPIIASKARIESAAMSDVQTSATPARTRKVSADNPEAGSDAPNCLEAASSGVRYKTDESAGSAEYGMCQSILKTLYSGGDEQHKLTESPIIESQVPKYPDLDEEDAASSISAESVLSGDYDWESVVSGPAD